MKCPWGTKRSTSEIGHGIADLFPQVFLNGGGGGLGLAFGKFRTGDPLDILRRNFGVRLEPLEEQFLELY